MHNDPTTTAAALRAEADRLDAEALASFERCDTDGALSQAAHRLNADARRLEATILERGGLSRFLTLFDLAGNWVPCREIQGAYGTRWMVLDADGRRTGEFLPHLPVRRDTLARRGYVEGYALWPATVTFAGGAGRGSASLVGARPVSKKAVPDHVPPTSVETVDRWADEASDD